MSKTLIMNLFTKVSSVPNICALYFDLSGKSIAFDPDDVNFHHTVVSNGLIQESYFQKSTVQFSEKASETTPGTKIEQTLTVSFNSSDEKRSERIMELMGVRHIIIKLTNGETLIMGRNDYFQNKKPLVTINSNHIKTTAEFYCESIIPISRYIGNVLVGLPNILPLTLV